MKKIDIHGIQSAQWYWEFDWLLIVFSFGFMIDTHVQIPHMHPSQLPDSLKYSAKMLDLMNFSRV